MQLLHIVLYCKVYSKRQRSTERQDFFNLEQRVMKFWPLRRCLNFASFICLKHFCVKGSYLKVDFGNGSSMRFLSTALRIHALSIKDRDNTAALKISEEVSSRPLVSALFTLKVCDILDREQYISFKVEFFLVVENNVWGMVITQPASQVLFTLLPRFCGRRTKICKVWNPSLETYEVGGKKGDFPKC